MRICHTADIQIRFGERHDEFREVFERLYEDLQEQKPDRIYVGGDLMHHKIKLSPQSFSLLVSFLTDLSKIAPTDVILGNHDLNMQNLDQGDVMSPIVETARAMRVDKAIIEVTDENKNDIDFWQNSIYYYPNSGFFDIGKDTIYGIFSCKDNKIIKLENPNPKKTYVAFWHGTIYGAIGDNGYQLPADKAFNLETFKNFDAVMMGDIHEYQVFREDETIAYCGSLIQNNFGESIDKGYLMWDLSDKKNITHQRRFILNDWGFAKLNITRGETIEERIENLQFSNDRKKTKIRVVYEDFAENYSLERERRIRDLIRDRYGCKEINVTFESIDKEEVDLFEDKEEGAEENMGMIDLLKEWIDVSENDFEDEKAQDLIDLAIEIDKEIGINEKEETKDRTSIVPLKLVVSNIFSFPEKRLVIDFDKYLGAMGIFGRNYSGKSNFIRAFIWAAFETVPSNNDSNTIVNLYTKNPKGYTILEVLINGVHYRITRQIEQKDRGSNSYKRKFERLIEFVEDGETKQKWQAVKSNSDTTEQKEVKRQIEEAIGSYDDFSINSLHIHESEDDYINLGQQEKNALFWKYNGLEPFKLRRDFARRKLNVFKKNHADLGRTAEIEDKLKISEEELKAKKITLESLEKEKQMNEIRKEDENKKILELTKKIKDVQVLPFKSKEEIQAKIDERKESKEKVQVIFDELKGWLDLNSKKELPFDPTLSKEELDRSIKTDSESLEALKRSRQPLVVWIEENPKKTPLDDSGASQVIMDLQSEVINLQNDLIVYQGQPCPTCGNATEKPNQDKEKEVKILIGEKNVIIERKKKLIKETQEVRDHNNLVNQKESNLSLISSKISNVEQTLESRKKEREMYAKSEGIIEHNKIYEQKKVDFSKAQSDLQSISNSLTIFQSQYEIFDDNEEIKKINAENEIYISDIEEVIDQYKIALTAVGRQINTVVGEISVLENNISSDKDLLQKIKEADRNFQIYSIYIQAVERDGIPSMIIKRRLPLINSRINSMISQIAKFKVSIEVDKKGDVKEYFYFMEDMRDRLPVHGSGSGAQKFLISLAIKDGLRYVSGRYVVQPSIFLIDEGFGTLHQESVPEMINILNYLKTKYRNLVIITHVDEIKDSADFVFEASKDRTMISEEDLEQNENAGMTVFTRK